VQAGVGARPTCIRLSVRCIFSYGGVPFRCYFSSSTCSCSGPQSAVPPCLTFCCYVTGNFAEGGGGGEKGSNGTQYGVHAGLVDPSTTPVAWS
jgi:hypothetical protein